MPTKKAWDQGIDLKEIFTPKKGRLIPLSLNKQEEASNWLYDQLCKGYICLSKSPMMSPVFFVSKKDGRKHMIQDYGYLNEHTVQNNYPLPLILQLMDRLKGAKLFMTLDLW